jgi:hypothetical protein
MNKELKLILSLGIIIGVCIFILKWTQYDTYQHRKVINKICLDEIKNQYFGIVDSIVIDNKHGDYFFVKKSARYHLRDHLARHVLEKGDSIVKKSGESRYIIYKKAVKNDSIILHFECESVKKLSK